jgi:hypothetical protein
MVLEGSKINTMSGLRLLTCHELINRGISNCL